METTVTEIAPDTFCISTYVSEVSLQFNQFLVRDEEPFLFHTGMRRMFPVTLEAVKKVIDPSSIRWVSYSHFEPDECGALNEWLQIAPNSQAVAGFVGAMVVLSDFADRPPRALADGEVFEIGSHRLRFLATPHVPHGWDAGLFFDETEQTLFCSDLFLQPGNPEPLRESDILGPVREAITASLSGPLANDLPYTPNTDANLQRLADLTPASLAVMHGSSYRGDGRAALHDLAGILRELLGSERNG